MTTIRDPNPLGKCVFCGKPIHYRDEFCAYCGKQNEGWREASQSQCGNCHARLDADDRFCWICGTKVGDGAYEPYQNLMQVIYGPKPEEREHTCRKCGYKWKTCMMLDREKYCPKCGGDAPYKDKEENFFGRWFGRTPSL